MIPQPLPWYVPAGAHERARLEAAGLHAEPTRPAAEHVAGLADVRLVEQCELAELDGELEPFVAPFGWPARTRRR